MCPENPMSYVSMGWVYQMDYWLGNTKSPRETIEKGIELAQKALAMDDSIAGAHALLCHLYFIKREYDKAIAEGERAVALDPGEAGAHCELCQESELRRQARRSHCNIPKSNPTQPLSVDRLPIVNFGNALRNDGAV